MAEQHSVSIIVIRLFCSQSCHRNFQALIVYLLAFSISPTSQSDHQFQQLCLVSCLHTAKRNPGNSQKNGTLTRGATKGTSVVWKVRR